MQGSRGSCYAVVLRTGQWGIVPSWAEAEGLVHGISGALFKQFPNHALAEAWVEQILGSRIDDGRLRAYVDGSYVDSVKQAGWAFAIVDPHADRVLYYAYGYVLDPIARNLDGECQAAIQALIWSLVMGRPILIVHDYQGVGAWGTGAWKGVAGVGKRYQQAVQRIGCDSPRFQHINGHSGDRFNDFADGLAGQGARSWGGQQVRSYGWGNNVWEVLAQWDATGQ